MNPFNDRLTAHADTPVDNLILMSPSMFLSRYDNALDATVPPRSSFSSSASFSSHPSADQDDICSPKQRLVLPALAEGTDWFQPLGRFELGEERVLKGYALYAVGDWYVRCSARLKDDSRLSIGNKCVELTIDSLVPSVRQARRPGSHYSDCVRLHRVRDR